mgnify:CR=1 FL=1
MNFYSKLKWTLGIVMVFAVVISTNLIDRNNFGIPTKSGTKKLRPMLHFSIF